ncbi:flagellar export chaperone FliS [Paenibacillus sp. MMS18-CY102]|uniref:flagellar export chaperone FliS n=1 Tax=Paenibacillus sp. MMS18-CY102 TaxID=2682849 RepID=UPI001365FC91|nr:flagellar export chaperone FliS [Paenibacillus sp. MMS18-CY102]MWC30911.1 flagellar export chaperone FliS [Paenibacillus sp. MMS18-CY102]
MEQRAQNHYMTTQVQTASPGELTLMLYNGCIKFVKLAKSSIEQAKPDDKHQHIVRAQNIIEELQVTLNMEYDISKNLFSLYDYMLHLLNQSDMRKDVEPLIECLGLLTGLRDTWGEAVKEVKLNNKVSI